jgi:hypothetical protein
VLSVVAHAREHGVLTVETGYTPAGAPRLHARLDRASGISTLARPRGALHGSRTGLGGYGSLRRAFRLVRARTSRFPGSVCVEFDRAALVGSAHPH